MKNNIDAIIVVEGSMDVGRISTYFHANFITTNGYEIPKEEIVFLKHLPKEKEIIILTDSDEAGNQIRNRLNEQLDRVINLKIDISKCNKNGKHGVAESEKDELISLLTPYIKEVTYGNLTVSDLINLGIDSHNKREFVSQKLHLGITNNKTFLKRVNYLNIEKETLRKIIKEYGN